MSDYCRYAVASSGRYVLTADLAAFGAKWLYRIVIRKSECPRSWATMTIGTPSWTSQEAKVCLSVWNTTRSRRSATPSLNPQCSTAFVKGRVYAAFISNIGFSLSPSRELSNKTLSACLFNGITLFFFDFVSCIWTVKSTKFMSMVAEMMMKLLLMPWLWRVN